MNNLLPCPCGAACTGSPYQIAAELYRLDCERAECGWCTIAPTREDCLSDWNTRAAQPQAPMPQHMVEACDKFDWTPAEALRFYAEGKHFDVVGGQTRILCTGSIASHALKSLDEGYAAMKGVDEPQAVDGLPEPVAYMYLDTDMGNQLMFQCLKRYWPKPYGGEHEYVQPVPLVRQDECQAAKADLVEELRSLRRYINGALPGFHAVALAKHS